jgi:hypothetical protein
MPEAWIKKKTRIIPPACLVLVADSETHEEKAFAKPDS